MNRGRGRGRPGIEFEAVAEDGGRFRTTWDAAMRRGTGRGTEYLRAWRPELREIQDSGINVTVVWFRRHSRAAWRQMNGCRAEEIVPKVADVLRRLEEAIAHFRPDAPNPSLPGFASAARGACVPAPGTATRCQMPALRSAS